MKKIICFIILWLVFIPKAQAHDWLLVNANSGGGTVSANVTTYYAPSGFPQGNTTEAVAQVVARDNYTLSKLFVRVISNGVTADTTVRSRVNGNYGNLIVTIPASSTGTFQDTTNSDTLVPGDLFCTELKTGATGTTIGFTINTAYVLTSTANKVPILIAYHNFGYSTASSTTYSAIIGRLWFTTTEASTQYTFRTSAVLSNFRVYVRSNGRSTDTTFGTRVNGNNGNQSVTVPSMGTGAFEDTTNTDIISPGNLVCYYLTTGSGAGTINISYFEIKSASDAIQVGAAMSFTTNLNYNSTRYQAIGGDAQTFNTSEAATQMNALTPFRARNMFVNIQANSINGSSTFRLRKNSGNSNLVVTVPASSTGFFEDTSNVDSFNYNDTINFSIVTGGTSGSMQIVCVAFEMVTAKRRTIIMMD